MQFVVGRCSDLGPHNRIGRLSDTDLWHHHLLLNGRSFGLDHGRACLGVSHSRWTVSLDFDSGACEGISSSGMCEIPDVCGGKLMNRQSYLCGTLNVYSWIATTAGIAIIVPQVVLAMVIAHNPSYVPQTWHYFLIYQIVNILVCLHNVFTLKKTLRLYDVACTYRTGSALCIYLD